MMRTFFFLLLPVIALAQTDKSPLRFEVCDIQVSKIVNPRLLKAQFLPGGRVDVQGMPLKTMIAAVNRLSEDMVTGPAWLASERYDIVAKAVPTSTEDQLFEMVRTMLAERFKMVAHTEKKVEEVYALAVGKKGFTIAPRTGPAATDPAAPRDGDCLAKPGPAGLVHRECRGVSMARLAGMLPRMAPNYLEGMLVIDQTGLDGVFDFQIDWMGRGVYNAALANTSGGSAGDMPVSLFDAVEKLGLKLDNRKLPVDTMVVDSILRTPVEN
jgi:uncharacterized protein (TIGR03435 family)